MIYVLNILKDLVLSILKFDNTHTPRLQYTRRPLRFFFKYYYSYKGGNSFDLNTD